MNRMMGRDGRPFEFIGINPPLGFSGIFGKTSDMTRPSLRLAVEAVNPKSMLASFAIRQPSLA